MEKQIANNIQRLLLALLIFVVVLIVTNVSLIYLLWGNWHFSPLASNIVVTVVMPSSAGITNIPVNATPTNNTILTTTPANGITSTATQSIELPVSHLLLCKEPKFNSCYYPPGISKGELIISLWMENLDPDKLPTLMIGDTKMTCSLSQYAQGVIVCTGPMVSSQEWSIELYSSDGKLLSDGKIVIDFTLTPIPTKRDEEQSYPNK